MTTWQLTVDCSDSSRLIEFWCAALGYVPEPAPDGWESWLEYWRGGGIRDEDLVGAEAGSGAIIDPEGLRPRIWFQEVPEPKVGKNRLHLDLRHTPGRDAMPYAARRASVDAEVARLVALGATVAYVNAPEGADYYAQTLRDPEGNEFCVV
ncbi:hypothetical protein BJ986_001223 [Phycicoccus badiiscoriae]|uniref:Glyoxalase-like domain-containing protein n=1 Tax=Pedococcus badiiscoriae TaxID=642776 RepID=A0A852WMU8_9MICO|nr:VOC family protein [Pedococcus badiiscoriae]NYG06736.1 hypothetical protein [Pedococcus badiiscoriae]